MSDPEATDPNPNLAKAEAAAKSIWAWGHIHTFLAWVAVGAVFVLALTRL